MQLRRLTLHLVDGDNLEIVLTKIPVDDEKKQWWKSVVEGDPEIDTELIEASKFLDESLLKKIKENKQQKAQEEKEAKEEALRGQMEGNV
jgi:hypothetical protein